MKQIALIGTTASGKTALALELARRHGGIILSLDSLAVYRHIDIASAKPTPKERGDILHLGIDVLEPHETFDATVFLQLYQEAYRQASAMQVPLLIVGGTGFYLKMLLEGISPRPDIDAAVIAQARHMADDGSGYRTLQTVDADYAARIQPTDRYRIQKALEIYLATRLTPTEYFAAHPPVSPLKGKLALFEIVWDRQTLRQRIALRTQAMLEQGLIDEVAELERCYTRRPNCMKAIGIKETLAYLDGRYDKETLREQITTHTAQLAKRQQTFNKTQFDHLFRGDLNSVKDAALQALQGSQ